MFGIAKSSPICWRLSEVSILFNIIPTAHRSSRGFKAQGIGAQSQKDSFMGNSLKSKAELLFSPWIC